MPPRGPQIISGGLSVQYVDVMNIFYPYEKAPLLETAEKYEFTRFEGVGYLEAWRCSRSTCVAQLTGDRQAFPEPPDSLPDADVVDTRDWLAFWLARDLTAADFKASGAHWVVKRFEVSKKLRARYRLPEMSRESGHTRDLELYALFGVLLGRFARVLTGPARWIPINALLKVNDILVSCRDDLGGSSAWAKMSLQVEQDLLP